MGYFNQYPYEDNEELNLDYVLAKITALKDQVNSLNSQIGAFNAMLMQKADKATTISGYGITDAYTKAEINSRLSLKADKSNTYTKTQVNNLLIPKVNASDLALVATSGNYSDLNNKPTAADITYTAGQSIKDGIDYIHTCDELLKISSVPDIEVSYVCEWQKYYFLSFETLVYNNVYNQMVIPTSYFSNTSFDARPFLINPYNNVTYQIWQNGDDSVKMKASSIESTYFRVYGIMKK